MSTKPGNKEPVDIEAYQQLFAPYEDQLQQFTVRENEFGGRFALLFRKVIRLLVIPGGINEDIPRMFIEVAWHYLQKDADIIRHFSYEENRHFFLSDLYDWLRVQELKKCRVKENQD